MADGLSTYLHDGFPRAAYLLFALVLTLVSGAAIHAAFTQGFSIRRWLRENVFVLVVSVAITLLVGGIVGFHYKFPADELEPISVSRSMAADGTAQIERMGRWDGERYERLSTVSPKRPLLLPFLGHLLHLARGYDPFHLRLVNLAALCLFLISLGSAFGRVGGKPAAFAAILMASSVPILSACATSASIDMLFLLFLTWGGTTLYRYLKDPTPTGLMLCWASLTLLCHTRYEGIVYFALVLVFLAGYRLLRWDRVRPYRYLYSVTALSFLIVFWQRVVAAGCLEARGGSSAFSLDHFVRHSTGLLAAHLDPGHLLSLGTAINWIGLASLIYVFVTRYLRGKRLSDSSRRFVEIALAAIFIQLGLVLAFHDGSYTSPISTRYFVGFSVLLGIAPVMAASLLGPTAKRAAVALSVVTLAVYLPVAARSEITNKQIFVEQSKAASRFLTTSDPRTTAIVTRFPEFYTVEGFSAVSFSMAQKLLDQPSKPSWLRDAIVIQEVPKGLTKVSFLTDFSKPVELRTLGEESLGETMVLRFSKLSTGR